MYNWITSIDKIIILPVNKVSPACGRINKSPERKTTKMIDIRAYACFPKSQKSIYIVGKVGLIPWTAEIELTYMDLKRQTTGHHVCEAPSNPRTR